MEPGNNDNPMNNDNGSSDTTSDQDSYNKLQNNYEDLNNRFIRLAADFENYKKRILKEKTDIAEYGNEDLIKELLNVLDNLHLAVNHAGPDAEVTSLVDGVKLVLNQFVTILEKHGLKTVDSTKGAEFNPMYHQAIERVETSEISSGLILEELVRGYILKERLLRPASVTVSTDIISNTKQVDKKNTDSDESNIEQKVDELIEKAKTSDLEEVEEFSSDFGEIIDLTDEEILGEE